ncbi:hypothetical protein ACIBJE_04690 [Micromonospora sp. NPDC050187]|uniref:hypothetical protein n=1 Tax=Micromonospora sp. NPDC050187 TaxID=3364277 RepID=UPI0037907ECA
MGPTIAADTLRRTYRDTDPKRYQRDRQRDRSLLSVAATRPRDELAVFWHGTPSPLLTSCLVQRQVP